MTREEAAIIIKKCKDNGFKHTFYTLTEYHTALDMAIQALDNSNLVNVSQDLVKDLVKEDAISRQAVLDKWDELSPRGRTEFDQVIMMMPSVTCSEKPNRCGDVIGRQDAIDAFGLSEKTRKYGGDHSGYETIMLYEVQDIIEGLPSIGREKTGWWHKKYDSIVNDYFWECDTCKCGFQRDYPYCPNCGAKMKGGKNTDENQKWIDKITHQELEKLKKFN